jgi:hypothetical protein
MDVGQVMSNYMDLNLLAISLPRLRQVMPTRGTKPEGICTVSAPLPNILKTPENDRNMHEHGNKQIPCRAAATMATLSFLLPVTVHVRN